MQAMCRNTAVSNFMNKAHMLCGMFTWGRQTDSPPTPPKESCLVSLGMRQAWHLLLVLSSPSYNTDLLHYTPPPFPPTHTISHNFYIFFQTFLQTSQSFFCALENLSLFAVTSPTILFFYAFCCFCFSLFSPPAAWMLNKNSHAAHDAHDYIDHLACSLLISAIELAGF